MKTHRYSIDDLFRYKESDDRFKIIDRTYSSFGNPVYKMKYIQGHTIGMIAERELLDDYQQISPYQIITTID